MMFAITLVLMFSILIIVHEYGHFLAARLSGITVEKFSIGFGPVLFSRKIKDTFFLISWVPIGGYVKLAGDSREEAHGKTDEFFSKPVGVRARVVFFGPLFNYFLSFIILCILYMVGMPYLDSVVGGVVEDTPAMEAELKEGDRITVINGETIDGWEDMQKRIRSSHGALNVVVEREGKTFSRVITPQEKKLKDIFNRERTFPVIGIEAASEQKLAKYSFFKAIYMGARKLGELTVIMLKGIYFLIVGAIPFRESVTGVVGVAAMTADAVKAGYRTVLSLTSVLGLSLALINLFPIPVLDGGHLFLFFIEKIRKRPVGEKTESVLTRIGIAIVGLIFFFTVLNDIERIVSKKHDGTLQKKEKNENGKDR